MEKKYKETLDNLDNFMIVLKKHKDLPDNSDIVIAVNKLIKSRNEFKTKYLQNLVKEKQEIVQEQENKFDKFAKFLDTVVHLT